MTLSPLLDRVTGFIARLADRIAGVGDRAGRDQTGRDQTGRDQTGRDPLAGDPAGLEPAHAGVLLTRLRHLAARFRAVAASPIPPPKPAVGPPAGGAEPRFVATYTPTDPLADSASGPVRLPRSWRWLTRLEPQVAAERAQLEELLRDPAMIERLAADPRLGRILRPLGWMLGVDRALLPASGWRRRQVILVPEGPAAAAAAEYAAARAKGKTAAEVIALCCVWVPHRLDDGWDRPRERPRDTGSDRPPRGSWLVWAGCEGPRLPGLARFSA